MGRAAAVPVIARLKVDLLGVVAACVRAWGWGSVVAAGGSDAGDSFDLALACSLSPQLVNDLVTFEPTRSTFEITPDPIGCPASCVGTFSCEARQPNASDHLLSDLFIEVTTSTGGNLFQKADGGQGRGHRPDSSPPKMA